MMLQPEYENNSVGEAPSSEMSLSEEGINKSKVAGSKITQSEGGRTAKAEGSRVKFQESEKASSPKTERSGSDPQENYLDSVLESEDFSSLTADEFYEIWQHYDSNGTHVLERSELNNFLTDLMTSKKLGIKQKMSRKGSSGDTTSHKMKMKLLMTLDRDRDGNISIEELAYALLSPEESLVLLFRMAHFTGTAHDFMKAWKRYDKNLSGYIEVQELKSLLLDLVLHAEENVHTKGQGIHPDNERLNEYVKTIMDIYDTNHDGKLSLSDLARLLLIKDNFVEAVLDNALSMDKLYKDDVIKLLDKYDKNGNGTLEGSELTNFVTDVVVMIQKDGKYDPKDVEELERSLLNTCDLNHDGKIDRKELAVILLAMAQSKQCRG